MQHFIDNYLIWILGIGISILLFFNTRKYLTKLRKVIPIIVGFLDAVGKYAYIASLLVPLIYLPYYIFIYIPFISKLMVGENYMISKDVHEYIRNASLVIFTGGIYTASMKWITNSEVFKDNFTKTILSKDFDDVLSKKMESLSLSNEYLLSRTDLNHIWERVTLSKYEQKFPEIAPGIKSKLGGNDLFAEDSLSYYIRNCRMQIVVELLADNIVKITEVSSFTILASSEEPIKLDFWISHDEEEVIAINNDPDSVAILPKIYSRVIPDKCKSDNEIMTLLQDVLSPEEIDGNYKIKKFKAELKGKKRYDIERSIEMTQDLLADREFGFLSSRIIDHLSVNLQTCDKLNLFFSPVNKNYFKLDNQITLGQSFVSRDIHLPGENFKIFIYEK